MPPLYQKPISSSLAVQTTATLSKDQTTFNTLIKKIEASRAKLADWNASAATFKQKYASVLHPLRMQERDLRLQLAQALDAAFDKQEVTKSERRKLSALITDLAAAVLEGGEHAEAQALYKQHNDTDFDEEESVLQVASGAVDLGSPDDVMGHDYQAQQEAHRAKVAGRKKSKKQLAKEAQREADEKQMSQSIREVYRKLASSLHPDREPDPSERQRKTVLMQQTNEAYEKSDLLRLLELQLQLEQIDQTHLSTLAPERLKHYIKILKDQLGELDKEIASVQSEFAFGFNLSPSATVKSRDLMPMLNSDIAHCKAALQSLRKHLASTRDVGRLKAWLKMVGP